MLFWFTAGCLTGIFITVCVLIDPIETYVLYKKKQKWRDKNKAWDNYRQGFYEEEQRRKNLKDGGNNEPRKH